MNLLGVDTQILDGRAVLSLSGELDLSTVPGAEESLLRLEGESGTELLVIDLSGLTFMDSTGLRFVLSACSRAAESARLIQILRGPEPVHRVFRLALLEERLPFASGDLQPRPQREGVGDGA